MQKHNGQPHPFRIVHVLTFPLSTSKTDFPFRHRFDLLSAVCKFALLAVNTLAFLVHLTEGCLPEQILKLCWTLLVITRLRVYRVVSQLITNQQTR